MAMIYRVEGEGAKIYQPLDWKAYSGEGQRVPLTSEPELREYLKRHPDEDFFLIPEPYMNREIQGETAATFNFRGEHIRCGVVRYDSTLGRVVTRDTMKVNYGERAKRSEEFPLLQQATERLE